MMHPESDSAFHAYYEWALEQEERWLHEQQELEQLEDLEDE